MAEIQYQLAPGVYVIETGDGEYQIAPSWFINETVVEAPPAGGKPTMYYVRQALGQGG